ncbi:MAG: hypothetical protein H7256_09715 [Bdellovibrio sp.]|nr:hypothetical protein [Bdellovibrio sp.]
MKYEISSHVGGETMPATQVYSLLDNQLLIFVRSWGSQDYNQKFVDEIMHFLSTAQADIEVTSPFDFVENLTSLANKVRISILLAHDYFYKSENKNSFSVGFETAILMRHKKELAWGTVGRFDVHQLNSEKVNLISASGTDRDQHVLLPIDLVGVEKDVDMRLGSIRLNGEKLLLSSAYKTNLQFKFDRNSKDWDLSGAGNDQATYWFSKITLD